VTVSRSVFGTRLERRMSRFKDGDVVEVEIAGIGVLRNPVRRER